MAKSNRNSTARSHKVLTVSYGSFSCTLEGFDDPFAAMKAIAEYFRELAEKDRYFGAEPPAIDAAMLHQIAERETRRQVETRISENGVVLTARPQPDESEDETAEAAPREDGAEQAEAAENGKDPESIAAKLMRIRAVVAASRAAAQAASGTDGEDASLLPAAGLDDDMPGPEEYDFGIDLDEGLEVVDRAEEAPEPAQRTEPEDLDDEIEAGSDAITPTVGQELTPDLPESEEPGESAKGDLGQIEATSEPASAAEEAQDMPDEAINTGTQETQDPVSSAGGHDTADESAAPSAPLRTDDAKEPDSPKAQTEALILTSAIDSLLGTSEVPKGGDRDRAAVPEAEHSAEQPHGEDDQDETAAAIFATLSADLPAADEDATYDRTDEDRTDEDATEEDATDAILRAQIGAAIGKTEEHDDPELERQLAQLAREVRREASEGREILRRSGSKTESLDRLLDIAKSKLEEPESRRRFAAITHLKAAVAATVADLRAGPSGAGPEPVDREAEAISRFRSDLSDTVRPRRPETRDETRAAEPARPRPKAETTKPAPLVLVSEYRVDKATETPEGDTPSAPREEGPQAREPMRPEDAKSFAEFAESLGAHNLAELLEAAAAYTALFEGMEQFSRPHILRKVAEIGADSDTAREERLRTFGMLLREGRIERTGPGQFRVSRNSRFLVEKRAASR